MVRSGRTMTAPTLVLGSFDQPDTCRASSRSRASHLSPMLGILDKLAAFHAARSLADNVIGAFQTALKIHVLHPGANDDGHKDVTQGIVNFCAVILADGLGQF